MVRTHIREFTSLNRTNTVRQTGRLLNREGEMKKEKPITYEPPEIITYTGEDILEEFGPGQCCAPSPCPITP